MTLKADIEKWNKESEKLLIKSYEQKGFKASGNWANSLQPKVSISPTKINVSMLGTDYTFEMINGRPPKKKGAQQDNPPLVDLIRKWIDDKKIVPKDITKEQLAWAITTKIDKKGYGTTLIRKDNKYGDVGARRKLLTDVYTDKRINELLDIIRQYYILEFRGVISKTLSNGSN